MSFVTWHRWWSTVGVTACQPEPLTCWTLPVNVQTGIESHVPMLTSWPLTFTTDTQEPLTTRLKGQGSNEAPMKKWSDLGERECSPAHKCVCLYSKQSADGKQHFCPPRCVCVCVCCLLMLMSTLKKNTGGWRVDGGRCVATARGPSSEYRSDHYCAHSACLR